MPTAGDDDSFIEFVYHEARLIDEKRFDEWYDLFADDGRYWMPLMRGQPEALLIPRSSTKTSCC
jgi:3-phenylpropionate/cinnamic acid dioxygenase small subunit